MNEVERFVFLLSMLTFLSLSFPVTVEGQFIQQNEVMDVSNLNVNDIAQDSVGYIWLATERGLDRLDGYQNHAYFDSNSSLSSSAMKKVYVNKSGVVYIFSALNDIYIYDRKVNNFIFIKNVSVDKWTTGITEDKSGTIWYGTGTGLYKIDAKSRTTHMVRMPLLMGPVADVEDSDNDLLWISMKNGKAYVYNYRQNKIVSVLKDGNFQQIVKGPWKNTLCGVQASKIIVFNSLTDKEIKTIVPPDINPVIIKAGTTVDRRLYFLTNECRLYIYDKNNAITSNYVGLDDNSNTYITDILIDKASNIWIGTMADGYKFISSKQSMFDVDNVLSNYFHNDFVTYLTGNGADKIWVATYYEGLKEFDRNTKTIKSILQFKREKRTIVPDVSCCFCDSKKRLWATSSDAVFCFKTNPVTTLLKKYSLKDVRYITEDRRGNILIISNDNGAFWKLSPNSDRPVRSYPTLSYKANIAFVTQLHSGKYLFSSYGYGVCIGDDKGHYSMMYNGMDFKNELCCVIYIYEDSRGLIWMGTYHYGLLCYNPRTRQMRHFTVKNGLPSNDVLAITSDKEGDIWMSTSYGLSKYVGHGSFVDYFTNGNLLGNQYHERSVFSDRGVLYFTGNHGMTSFIPEKVKVRHNDIPFMIDYISTDKQTYYLLGLKDSETLKLSYKEGSFNVSFLGLDFASSNNLRYSYMLEGFDKTWSTPSSIRSVSYSNVTPGTYYLKAKVCDADGQWNNKILTLKIVVPAAPWASWWANIIYALIILFIVYWVLRVYNEYKLNQERAKLSEKTLAQERDLNQAKINFFENVSHELRTPLGLIYAPFCELLKIGSFTKRECEYMSLIGSNIDRLMVLIEQILSFAQLKSETMPLQVSKVDIVGIAWKVLSRFRGENEEKHIETSFSSTEEHIIMYVDEDKLDKILSNLLSNAYKYTPSRGNIVMSMRTVTADEVTRIFGNNDLIDTSYVLVSIKDSGIGIDKDEINKIFDRFYRSSKRKVSLEVGNGIGLYYIKCLVTKQKGLIKAERNVDKGSNFMFCLPMSDTSFSPSEIKGEQKGTEADAETLDYDTQISLLAQKEDKPEESIKDDVAEKPLLLIIEDEIKLQEFLGLLLGRYYKIQKAFDGKEGLEIARKTIPDIILLDVMMPVMDGYEVCEKIKNDINTCHIPVVMLSAKSNVGEQIEGVNSGADVYVPKPFHPDYLISVLQGVLSNRKRVQNLIIENRHTDNVAKDENVVINQLDKKLLTTLDQRIENNIGDDEFSIDALAKELFFSRSTFYRKIRSLTGVSPKDYIRIYRLKKAARLIESGEKNLSEIADITGFSTQTYFSAVFKKQFGMTPSEYKTAHDKSSVQNG